MSAHRMSRADEAMTRYGQGQALAFGIIYDEVAPRIEKYLRRHLREASLIEDLVQQTFENMHRARGTFLPGFPVLPWAFTIARRLMIDSPRRRRREVSRDMQGEHDIVNAMFAVGCENGEEMVQAIETRARLREAFDHLSPKRRSIFEHVRIEGLSYATVAAMHGVTEDSVRMHMHQASKALRAAVHEAGGGLASAH